MNRKDYVRQVTAKLRELGVRKRVSPTKQTFHISDDEGNSKDFIVRTAEKNVIYNYNDIDTILDVLLDTATEILRTGDTVSLRGFGVLGLKYRKPRATKDLTTGEWIEIAGKFIPKFTFGEELRRAAKGYELSLAEKLSDAAIHKDLTSLNEDFLDDGMEDEE